MLPILGLTACTTPSEVPATKDVTGTKVEDSTVLTELPPRDPSSAMCGLFIWQSNPERSFILHEDRQSASVLRGGREVAIMRIDTGDTLSVMRTYKDGAGQEYELRLGDMQIIETGTRYKSGHLSYDNIEGWAKVIPIVGISTCQR